MLYVLNKVYIPVSEDPNATSMYDWRRGGEDTGDHSS